MQPDSSNILKQFCCENRVVLFLQSVVLSVVALCLKRKVLLHALVGMFVIEMGWYALLLIESMTLKKTYGLQGIHTSIQVYT